MYVRIICKQSMTLLWGETSKRYMNMHVSNPIVGRWDADVTQQHFKWFWSHKRVYFLCFYLWSWMHLPTSPVCLAKKTRQQGINKAKCSFAVCTEYWIFYIIYSKYKRWAFLHFANENTLTLNVLRTMHQISSVQQTKQLTVNATTAIIILMLILYNDWAGKDKTSKK